MIICSGKPQPYTNYIFEILQCDFLCGELQSIKLQGVREVQEGVQEGGTGGIEGGGGTRCAKESFTYSINMYVSVKFC